MLRLERQRRHSPPLRSDFALAIECSELQQLNVRGLERDRGRGCDEVEREHVAHAQRIQQQHRRGEQRRLPAEQVEQVAAHEERAGAGDEVEAGGRGLLLDRRQVERRGHVAEAAADDADVITKRKVVDRRKRRDERHADGKTRG